MLTFIIIVHKYVSYNKVIKLICNLALMYSKSNIKKQISQVIINKKEMQHSFEIENRNTNSKLESVRRTDAFPSQDEFHLKKHPSDRT